MNRVFKGALIVAIMVVMAGIAVRVHAGETTGDTGEWQTVTYENWTFTVPGNWTGDEETGLWQPGKPEQFMGRPPVSLHIGGIPLMPGTAFEDRVKTHIQAEMMDKKEVQVSGMDGFTCSWETSGHKYTGVFLLETITPGMGVINFLNCRAPSTEFDTYSADFEKIVVSLKK